MSATELVHVAASTPPLLRKLAFVVFCGLVLICSVIQQQLQGCFHGAENLRGAAERNIPREQALLRTLEKERALRQQAELKSEEAAAAVAAAAGNKTDGYFAWSVKNIDEVEQRAEIQYWYQRGEQNENVHPALSRYGANWPCSWGEELIGIPGSDGSKWTCGVRLLKSPCVVYSFGSAGDMQFEKGIFNLGLGCEVHIFDPTSSQPSEAYALNFTYHEIGLGRVDGQDQLLSSAKVLPVQTLSTAMASNGHKHIDILKVDIEFMEHSVFAQLGASTFPSIGQLLLEAHIDGSTKYDGIALKKLFKSIEQANLRLFHHEVNFAWGADCCIEYSFIHKSWRPEVRKYNMRTAPSYKDVKLRPKPQSPRAIEKYLKGKEKE